MKVLTLALFALLALVPFLGGCTTTPVTPAQFDQTILADSATIKSLAAASTSIALLNVDEAHRPAATAEVHNLAEAVLDAVDQQTPTVTGFRTIVEELLNKSNSQYVIIAGTVFDSVAGIVDAQLATTYANLDQSTQAKAALDLVRAVADGVVQATSHTYSLPNHPVGPKPTLHSDARSLPNVRVPSPFEVEEISAA